jgi:flagellar protein FliO/FliZ
MGLFGLVKQCSALVLFSMLLLSTPLAAGEAAASEPATAASVTTTTPATASTTTEQANAAKEPVVTVPVTAAKGAEQSRANALPGVGQIVISLALVVGLVLLLAFFYKKMQLKLPGNKHFRIVATLNIGQRERLLVIEMQGKQRVLGVTAQQINFLFDLETPLPEEKLASDFHTQLQSFLKK